MKKVFLFHKEDKEQNIGEFDNLQEAQERVLELVEDDEDLSIFDYHTKEVEVEDITTLVDSYESACSYLERGSGFEIKGVATNPHEKAVSAIHKLFTIAEAWNKSDNFKPDFSNGNQWKYFPWFVYSNDAAGFVSAYTNHAATYTLANLGSRLCCKSHEREKQFGVQFIELWNDVLLLNQ